MQSTYLHKILEHLDVLALAVQLLVHADLHQHGYHLVLGGPRDVLEEFLQLIEVFPLHQDHMPHQAVLHFAVAKIEFLDLGMLPYRGQHVKKICSPLRKRVMALLNLRFYSTIAWSYLLISEVFSSFRSSSILVPRSKYVFCPSSPICMYKT